MFAWIKSLLGRRRPVSAFRASPYIDFNTGAVTLAPMELKARTKKPWSLPQKIDLFECRVEVWQLGAAVAMLKAIESAKPGTIWSHSAYGLVAIAFSYFEMIGKTVNPHRQSSPPRPTSAGDDFNYGFCDVYPRFMPSGGNCDDKANTPGTGKTPNPAMAEVNSFRDRVRNGLYHLGYTKNGVWLHDDAQYKEDFERTTNEPDPDNQGHTIERYRINPHRMTRTVLAHFPGFTARLRNVNNAAMHAAFLHFFDDLHAV